MTDRLHDDGSGDPCGPTPSFGARLALTGRQYLAGPGGIPGPAVTNRISSLGSPCFPAATAAYDEVGSLVQDQFGTYQHDALSRLEVATPFGGDPELHGFDAADRRVRRAVGDVTRSWVRGPDGAVLAEYESVGGGAPALVRRHVNAFGNVVADVLDDTLDPQGDPEVRFHHHDHLGSTRVVTDAAGLAAGARILHFTPFGAEVPDGDGACPEGRYALHERDDGTGLTYMLARFQSPWHARFLEVDPADESAVLGAPQTWNRYGYAGNDPADNVDPDGESWIKYAIRGATGTIRGVRRAAAVRTARRAGHAVKVIGPGASQEARRLVREAHPGAGVVRHDHGSRHWQPAKTVKAGGSSVGHVHYRLEWIVGLVAGMSALAGQATEAATG